MALNECISQDKKPTKFQWNLQFDAPFLSSLSKTRFARHADKAFCCPEAILQSVDLFFTDRAKYHASKWETMNKSLSFTYLDILLVTKWTDSVSAATFVLTRYVPHQVPCLPEYHVVACYRSDGAVRPVPRLERCNVMATACVEPGSMGHTGIRVLPSA